MRILAEAAQQAERQVDQKVGQAFGSIPQAPTPETATFTGVEQFRAMTPGWENAERFVSEEIEINPAVAEMVTRAIQSGDSANVAMALSGAHAAAQTRQQARSSAQQESLLTMKMNAQSMRRGRIGRAGSVSVPS